MTLKELREKAGRAIALAANIRDDSRSWPEKQTAFDAAVTEATDAQKEIQTIEGREANLANLTAMEQQHRQTANRIIEPGATEGSSSAKPGEVFGVYLKSARYNHKSQRVEARGFTPETIDRCLEMHHEAFKVFLRDDVTGLQHWAQQAGVGPKEIHALLSNDQTLGGFTVPEDIRAEVIKAEAGYAVLAPLCRTEPTNSDALVFPKVKPHGTDIRRTSGFTGKFQQQGYVTGGTAPTVQNQPTFQRERIPVHSWQPDAVEISPELLEDSGANIDLIVAEAIGEALAFDKDDMIYAGTGVNQPEGVTVAGITTVNSGGATSIAYGGMVNLYTGLPAQYRGKSTFVMSSKTMGVIIQLNTGTGGVYLFPPNQWNEQILNRPVRFLDYGMPEPTTGTTYTAGVNPVIFGDWSRYIIAQRAALRIQRLVERFAPNVGILPTARLGGQVVLTDAFRIMTVAA